MSTSVEVCYTIRLYSKYTSLINQSNCGANTLKSNSLASPLTQFIEIPVNDIDFCDFNPRRINNPEYARLRDSLACNGLEVPLTVSLNPHSKRYTLYAGGNTRLAIAQSLYQEGNISFAQVPCVVKNWTNEAGSLIAHLRENDIRGELSFIDRALAVKQFAGLVQDKNAKKPLSQRALVDKLRSHGYRVSQPVIATMQYAVNRLVETMPRSLNEGLGKRQINAIRSLDLSAKKVWQQCCPEDKSGYDSVFRTLCERQDEVGFDLSHLTTDLAHEIALAADLDFNAVLLMLDADRVGDEIGVTQFTPLEIDDTRKRVGDATQHRPFNLDKRIRSLQKKLANSAIVLAEALRISDCIQVTPDERFGYFMKELPLGSASKKRVAGWKLLAMACEQSRISKRNLMKQLSDGSRLTDEIEVAGSCSQVYAKIAESDLLDIGQTLIKHLDNHAWKHLLTLLDEYRQLRNLISENNLNL